MKRHRKFIINFFIITVLITMAYWTLVLCFFKMPMSFLNVDVYLNAKEELARKIDERKIVFTSGSSTFYGIRTKDIQAEFNVPVISLAVTATVQIDYILYRVKRVLRSGDTVILPLEYNHFVYDGSYSEVKSFFLMTYDVDYFKKLPFSEQIISVVYVNPPDFFKSLKEQVKLSEKNLKVSTMKILENMNENGDSIYSVGNNKDLEKNLVPVEIQYPGYHETLGLKYIKEFSDWCKENNVKLYLTYANTLYFDEYDTSEYRSYFEFLQRYFKDNNISTIGSPYDFFYKDINMFYDTKYHLTQEGMTIRTRQFMNMMKDLNIVKGLAGNVELAIARGGVRRKQQ